MAQHGTVGAAVDLSQRFGVSAGFGARLNASAERLDPHRDGRTATATARLATDWRAEPRRRLSSSSSSTAVQSQPSVPAFSMLGDAVPDRTRSTRINLNDQPWSLPDAFDATHRLAAFRPHPGRWLALDRPAGTQHV